MRLAIIGNSHLVAPKLAISENRFDPGEADVVFWGQPGRRFQRVELADGVLLAPEPKVTFEISGHRYKDLPIADFDVLVFHGHLCRPNLLLEAVLAANMDLAAVSTNFLNSMVRDVVEATVGLGVARAVSTIAPGKVYVSPTPLPSEKKAGNQGHSISDVAWSRLLAAYGITFKSFGMEFVSQPRETLVRNWRTISDYSVGSVRFDKGRMAESHGEEDHAHMNAHYGALVLRDLFDACGITTPGPVASRT